MSSSNKKSSNQPPHDTVFFMSWGTLIGAVAGAAIGYYAGHWVFWTVAVGVTGMIVGALIDRSRR